MQDSKGNKQEPKGTRHEYKNNRDIIKIMLENQTWKRIIIENKWYLNRIENRPMRLSDKRSCWQGWFFRKEQSPLVLTFCAPPNRPNYAIWWTVTIPENYWFTPFRDFTSFLSTYFNQYDYGDHDDHDADGADHVVQDVIERMIIVNREATAMLRPSKRTLGDSQTWRR